MTARRGGRRELISPPTDKVAMMAAPQSASAFPEFKTVLVLVALPATPVNRALSRHAIDSSPDGVLVHVFDDLARVPRYNEALETEGTPDAVVALRAAVSAADAVLVITSYRGRVPSMAHSAIDWLTRRWRPGELYRKPIAVIGRSTGCYSGVWTRQIEDTHGRPGCRVIEPITVPTLREAVKRLGDEARGCSAAATM